MPETLTTNFFLEQDSFRNWALGINEADCLFWDNWLIANPLWAAKAMSVAASYAGASPTEVDLSAEEVRAEWHKVQQRIIVAEGKANYKPKWTQNWYKVAASVLLAVGLGGWGAKQLLSPYERVYQTDYLSREQIRLSDGTEITLNCNSSLKLRSSWRFAPAREIWLQGEAFFIVASHPGAANLKNFVVHTNDLDVRVIGTKFNVNAREKQTKVYLDEGKVQVDMKDTRTKSLILAPGEEVSYSATTGCLPPAQKARNAASATSWKSGNYTFSKTSLADVFALIKDNHGITVHVADSSLLKQTITGTVPSNRLNELFGSIGNLFQVKFRRKGTDVYIVKAGPDDPT